VVLRARRPVRLPGRSGPVLAAPPVPRARGRAKGAYAAIPAAPDPAGIEQRVDLPLRAALPPQNEGVKPHDTVIPHINRARTRTVGALPSLPAHPEHRPQRGNRAGNHAAPRARRISHQDLNDIRTGRPGGGRRRRMRPGYAGATRMRWVASRWAAIRYFAVLPTTGGSPVHGSSAQDQSELSSPVNLIWYSWLNVYTSVTCA
jgi:hypothetical protein